MPDTTHNLDQLAALAEGRLDESQRQRVTAHVAECLECRRVLAELARAVNDGSLRRSTVPAAPARTRWSNTRVWLPIAASVLVGSFAWFQFAGLPEGSRPSSEAPGVTDEDLLRTRGAGRTIAGKTFRQVSGEWVDTTLDPRAALPAVTVRGVEERRALLVRIPELAPYSDLGDRVVVVWQGTVYRFEP